MMSKKLSDVVYDDIMNIVIDHLRGEIIKAKEDAMIIPSLAKVN